MPTVLTPSQPNFPTLTVTYKYATSVNAAAFSYQMSDLDAPRNRVVYYPYGARNPSGGGGVPTAFPNNMLLTYVVGASFAQNSSFRAYNLATITGNAHMGGFGGGFLDSANGYAYLPGAWDADVSNNIIANPWTLRIDLAQDLNSSSAYQPFNISTLGISPYGFFSGIFLNGHGYFAPTIDWNVNPAAPHGNFVQFDSSQQGVASGGYANAASWQVYDLSTHVDPRAIGSQSLGALNPWVYVIPFALGEMVRYDTRTAAFQTSGSYQKFDLSVLAAARGFTAAQLTGFTGAVSVGTRIVFIPCQVNGSGTGNSVALLYDATDPDADLSTLSLWQAIDLATVDPACGGYQFGWLDRDGFVWFVPTFNFKPAINGPPPFTVWNSHLPFTDTASWAVYPNAVNTWYTGVAYDPATNSAYPSPYSGHTFAPSANLLQIQEVYAPPPVTDPRYHNAPTFRTSPTYHA
jgi:hypothetical protein